MRFLAGLGVGLCFLLAWTSLSQAQHLSTFGTPGLIDMPTAEVMPDGNLATTTFVTGEMNRNTIAFQILPRVYGSFRYSYLKDFGGASNSLYDRSFDIHYQIRNETKHGPALAIGIRDFGGTGIYGSEYIATTKNFANRFKITAGLGWGRLGQRNSFTNPLGILDERFKVRPANNVGVGGQFSFNQWFRGPAAVFAGAQYEVTDRLTLLAEYSSDTYVEETSRMGFDATNPFNLGASYRFDNGLTLNGYVLHGTSLGFQLSYMLDPRKARAPGGQDAAAPALSSAQQVALASWNLPPEQSAGDTPSTSDVLSSRLDDQGQRLVGFEVAGERATVEVENNKFHVAAQAIGRTARAMANTLHPSVEVFVITLRRQGLPITTAEIRRADLYDLENELDGAWMTFARASIRDAPSGLPAGTVEGAYPHLSYFLGPYGRLSFFDPDNPLRYEVGVSARATYVVRPGLTFLGVIRQPVASTLSDTTRVSDSVLPHVRSDWARYSQESDLQIGNLTAEYLWRPGPDLFARVTAGYLEEMYGGLSAELLWFPSESRLAFGAELNYVKQRDFDMLFGFQDYNVVTGHVSMYYNTPGDYLFQFDVGRYLAGDVGVTFGLDREFNNGFKVGAFATLTNVSSATFGEGSFDKGIRFEVPLSWFTGTSTKAKLRQVIRPILRDGGARLNVANRLYEYTREERAGRIAGQWGRFYR
ncbi:YjbH domain-containing protein [Pseudophaeobacter sp.]|uniref:YjbH domain-containing protein n=1 Tax=Pseudophaeobacter sp. TaxID=1971739 RepID=UPI003298CA47